MQKLICISGLSLGDEYELTDGISTMGRSMQNDICILDTESSRYHCKIANNSGTLTLEDLNSTNGISVNNKSVAGVIELTPGDLIKIGNTAYQVYDPHSTTTDISQASRALLNGAESPDDLLEKTTMQITKTVTIPKVKGEKNKRALSFFKDED